MSSVKNALDKVIHGNDNFCCLCFEDAEDKIYTLEDQVFVDIQSSQSVYTIMESLFDEEFLKSITSFGTICSSCHFSCMESYRFIQTSKQNYQSLITAVDCITASTENSIQDHIEYKNLYISLNVDDLTCTQYYDDEEINDSVSVRINDINQSEMLFDNDFKAKSMFECHSNTDICADEVNSAGISTGIQLVCKVCLKSFNCKYKARRHFYKFHNTQVHNTQVHKCSKCLQEFDTKDSLNTHQIDTHDSVICSECGKVFTNKNVLKTHELNHNVQLICPDCGRMYKSFTAFKKHKKDKICQQKTKKSSKEGEYQCDVCKKTFCTKPYLAKHLKYEHGGAEGFRCQYCSKQFYAQSKLETHIVKHTREKKFVCNICDGRFGTQMALVYHTRLHTGEKPYGCEFCSAAFVSASRRLDHTRRHHLQPNLECDICHVLFKTSGSLLKHRKRHFNPHSRLRYVLRQNPSSAEENVCPT